MMTATYGTPLNRAGIAVGPYAGRADCSTFEKNADQYATTTEFIFLRGRRLQRRWCSPVCTTGCPC